MKNRTLGSSLLVAGTSIGAGMLALPLISAVTGLWWALVLMFFMVGLAYFGGLLIAEACRACPSAQNLHGVVGLLLGRTGQLIAMFGMLFLYYSLCAAYISGGASILQMIFQDTSSSISREFACVSIATVVAILVVAGTGVVDAVNRTLFALMLILLAIILISLTPQVRLSNLALYGGSPEILLAALPVLYTSFGFHCTVPTVVQYVDGNPKYFRAVLLGGSALPFSVYLFWMMMVIGVLSATTVTPFAIDSGGVSALMKELGKEAQLPNLNYLISAFAAFAISTSFLGVSLGLFDYLAEVCHRIHDFKGRVQTIILTLLLPLLAALYMPGSFVTALGYAAIALVILAVFIPVAMVWNLRKQRLKEPYQVAGGIPAMVLAVMCGGLIIIAQLGIVFNWLPAIG